VNRPSFTFRLERVRALRERAEDQAKEELAGSMTLRMRGESMLRSAQEELEQARVTRRFSTEGRDSSAGDLAAAQAYVEKAERRRESAALDLDRQEAEVDARQAALEHAARERQVLERLKERRRSEHATQVARAESAMLDELALTVHRRGAGA
jgi:flagellar protein FliJ